MKKWRLIIDVERCEDCNNCFLACKDEHVGNEHPGYAAEQPRHGHRWMNISRKERGSGSLTDVFYLPQPCMHCENAPCVTAGKGAVTRRPDGIVLINPVKAKGMKDLVKSCPYGAIWWNEEAQLPQKCTLCAHLLDSGWTKPRCVQACPSEALRIIKADDEEMRDIIAREGLEPYRPEHGTSPGVLYRNLKRHTHAFIAGSVARKEDDITDCVKGARVRLYKDGRTLAEAVTDCFGDFKFDGLEENSGGYGVDIKTPDASAGVDVELQSSVNLGDIYL